LHKALIRATLPWLTATARAAVDGGEGDPGEDQSRETFAAGSGERAGRETLSMRNLGAVADAIEAAGPQAP